MIPGGAGPAVDAGPPGFAYRVGERHAGTLVR